jgi:hypothetical protein
MSETKEKPFQLPSNKNEWKRYFNYRFIVKNIPFFLFLSVLAVIYIYNGHYADKLIRRIGTSEKNIKELEYEYKTIKSEVIFRSKATEMVKAVAPMGLMEMKESPVKLYDSMPPIK